MSWVAVAIGGSAALGAGASIYSANRASRSAQQQAQQSQDFYAQQTEAARQLEEAQLEDYLGIARPQLQTQRDIFQQYARPQADIQNRLFTEGADLYSQVYGPSVRQLNTRLLGDLNQENGLPPGLSDQLFQTQRRRIAENFAPFREQATQRLASAGTLDTGIANQVFQRFDDTQLQQLADASFQQALQEFEWSRSGKQQAIANLLASLGMAAPPTTPGLTGANVSTAGVTAPGARIPYTPPAGPDYSNVFANAVNAAKLGSSLFGQSSVAASPATSGSNWLGSYNLASSPVYQGWA